MADDPNKPVEPYQLWDHMRTMNRFRAKSEDDIEKLRVEIERISDEVKEILLCVAIFRKIIPWFWGVILFIAGTAGTVIGMLYKLVPPGSL
jgi:hypothetical protein